MVGGWGGGLFSIKDNLGLASLSLSLCIYLTVSVLLPPSLLSFYVCLSPYLSMCVGVSFSHHFFVSLFLSQSVFVCAFLCLHVSLSVFLCFSLNCVLNSTLSCQSKFRWVTLYVSSTLVCQFLLVAQLIEMSVTKSFPLVSSQREVHLLFEV